MSAVTRGTDDLAGRIGDLVEGTWALAALSAALDRRILQQLAETPEVAPLAKRSGMPPAIVERVLDVLVALGVVERRGGGYAATAAAQLLLQDPAGADRLAADIRGALLQAADLSERARRPVGDVAAWHHDDPEILRAQGGGSSAAVPALSHAVIPLLGDLAARMEKPGACALDVGSGIGTIAIAVCRRYPQARVVALEPSSAALAEARRNIVAAGVETRIDLRAQRVEDLHDEDRFDFAFLPIVFLPTEAVRDGLAGILRALKPGGWVIMGSLGAPGDDLRPALARLRATLWGSEALSPATVAELCRDAGYAEVRELGTSPGSALTVLAAQRTAS